MRYRNTSDFACTNVDFSYTFCMSNFDTLFFEQHIAPNETIERVFHRHIFVMVEDIVVWLFFGILVPGFLFYYNVFEVRTHTDPTWVYAYLFLIYFTLLYKIFDWYLDVWIATNETLVQMNWKWFTPHLIYIPYDKIEGVEVRTHSWLHAMVGISDVSINLAGDETHKLRSAAYPKEVSDFIQNAVKPKKPLNADDREPFEVLVDALSGVVKDHLSTSGKEYLTRDYIEKLDTTLSHGIPIDLRSDEEKRIVENWKIRVKQVESAAKETEEKDTK